MQKSLTLLVAELAAVTITLLLLSRPVFGHQQPVRLATDRTDVILTNGTVTINLTLTIDIPATTVMEQVTDNVHLIIEIPGTLKDNINLSVIKNGKIIMGSSKIENDKIELNFILEEDIKINKTQVLNYTLSVCLKDIDCQVISQILLKRYELKMYAFLNLNGFSSNMISLEIKAKSEDFLKACFTQAFHFNATGKFINNELCLNLIFTVEGVMGASTSLPLNLSIKDFGIVSCKSGDQRLSCEVKDGRAVIKGDIELPARFNLTVILPREAFEKEWLEVWVSYNDRSKNMCLKPSIRIMDKRLAGGFLMLILSNDGTLPYNASKCYFTPREIASPVETIAIINPNERMILNYSLTPVSSENLSTRLAAKFNCYNITENIVFIFQLREPMVDYSPSNKTVKLTIRIDGNQSLPLIIPGKSPLEVRVEGFSIISCTTSGSLNCTWKDGSAFINGTVVLPSSMTLTLQVRDLGGPENRKVKVILSSDMTSEGTISIGRRQDKTLILGIAVTVLLVVLSAVLILRGRRREAPEETLGTRIEEEIFFDLG